MKCSAFTAEKAFLAKFMRCEVGLSRTTRDARPHHGAMACGPVDAGSCFCKAYVRCQCVLKTTEYTEYTEMQGHFPALRGRICTPPLHPTKAVAGPHPWALYPNSFKKASRENGRLRRISLANALACEKATKGQKGQRDGRVMGHIGHMRHKAPSRAENKGRTPV